MTLRVRLQNVTSLQRLDYKWLQNVFIGDDNFLNASFMKSIETNQKVLDYTQGFHYVPIKGTPSNKRLSNALPILPLFSLTELVLQGLTCKNGLVYLDDIMVMSRNFDEHLLTYREVFTGLRNAHLELNVKKCNV